jgi:hypothetical protein
MVTRVVLDAFLGVAPSQHDKKYSVYERRTDESSLGFGHCYPSVRRF